MYWCNFNNFKNIRADTRCIKEVEQFFQVIGDECFSYGQEFTGNIVHATVSLRRIIDSIISVSVAFRKYIDLSLIST